MEMIPQEILDIAKREGKDFRIDKNNTNWIISGYYGKIPALIQNEIEELGYFITEDYDYSYGYPQYRYKFTNNLTPYAHAI